MTLPTFGMAITGRHFHIPHGLSNALVLPHVLRFNAVTAHHAYVDFAPHLFPDLSQLEGLERDAAFCDRLAALSINCGLPPTLRDMKITEDWLPKLESDAMNQSRLLVNNPRPVTKADARPSTPPPFECGAVLLCS